MPGSPRLSMFPRMWAATGLDYPALVDRLIQLALAPRHRAALSRRPSIARRRLTSSRWSSTGSAELGDDGRAALGPVVVRHPHLDDGRCRRW